MPRQIRGIEQTVRISLFSALYISTPSVSRSSPARLCAVVLAAMMFALASPAGAQETYEEPSQDIVVDLAAGRVVILVVKDAILIGTVENPIEAETRPPVPVRLGSERVGMLLGAVDWFSPSTQQNLARLDRELPGLRRSQGGASSAPHLQGTQGGSEATDIEAIGQGLLERLNGLAKGFHNKISLPADEPLAEVIVADYLAGYGPEVWQLTYSIEQNLTEHEDYWNTRVLRPQYLQFWPPEKKDPKTLVEFDYPPENAPASLLDLLRQKDPRLEAIVSSDAKMAEIADHLLNGESNKILAVDATQFLRAALNVLTPPKARQTMAVIGVESGFQWILQPPVEPVQPGQQKEREPGAPSLLNPHPSR
jgi:hypothetical protein